MEPPRRCGEIWVIPTSHLPTQLRRRARRHPHLPHPTPHAKTPHLAHIDEDALEGVYFAFSSILRCLPYFLRKTRPRASYELLEAFSPSCGECGVTSADVGNNPTLHAHTWEPGILKVGLSITREPLSRPQDWGTQGGASRPSESDNPYPARPILSPPHPARPHPNPHTPTPPPTRPHPRAHTQRKKI